MRVGAVLTPNALLQQSVKLLAPQHHVPSVHCVKGVQPLVLPPSYFIEMLVWVFVREVSVEDVEFESFKISEQFGQRLIACEQERWKKGLASAGNTISLFSLFRQFGICHAESVQ